MSLRDDLEAAASAPGQKISKQRAAYGVGKPNAHCSLCRHFEPPASCEIVAGRIDPKKWCRFFEKKAKVRG